MVGRTPATKRILALIARNVYDDQGVVCGAGLAEPPANAPNLAVVSNHLIAELAERLEAASERELCHFTQFGYPDSSVPITPELLIKFDAVITVGRTVLPRRPWETQSISATSTASKGGWDRITTLNLNCTASLAVCTPSRIGTW